MTPTLDKVPSFSLLARELEQCGWRRARAGSVSSALENGLFFQTAQGGVRAPSSLFDSDRGASLLVIDFGEFVLSGHEELFPRFLDFSMETRLALGAARLIASAGSLLLLSSGRIQLYRLPDESMESEITPGRSFEEDLLPLLAARAMARDSSTAPGNPMKQAEALRGWLRHWSHRLASQLEVSPADCEQFLWKIALMLQVARKTSGSELLGGWGSSCEQTDSTWSLAYDSLNTHADLARLF